MDAMTHTLLAVVCMYVTSVLISFLSEKSWEM